MSLVAVEEATLPQAVALPPKPNKPYPFWLGGTSLSLAWYGSLMRPLLLMFFVNRHLDRSQG
jgi:hypothetical protein